MEKNVEEKKIDTLVVLSTIMDTLITYIDTRSLSGVVRASIFWRDEAIRERAKRANRFNMPLLRLATDHENLKLARELDLYACATLLFYKGRNRRAAAYYQDRILDYSMKPTDKAVAIGVDEQFMANDADSALAEYCPKVQLKDSSDIVGLAFSHINRDYVHMAYASILTGINVSAGQKSIVYLNFLRQLRISGEETDKSTILLFVKRRSEIAARFVNNHGHRHDIIVFHVGDIEPTSDDSDDETQNCVVGLRISSSKVESWVSVIHGASPIEVFEQKLLELKERVKPRRRSIGLLGGPYCDKRECDHLEHPAIDRSKIVESLKSVFPKVPFLGLLRANHRADNYRKWHGQDFSYDTRILRDTTVMIITFD